MSNDRMLDVIAPLAGVLVGGLVTYLTTRALEIRRWRQEKKDRLAQARRDALAKALEWIEPMDRALSSASMKVSARLGLALDDEQFLSRFPNLIADLAKLDTPAALRPLLTADAYADGRRIVQMLEELRAEAIQWGQQAELEQSPMLGLRECGQKLDGINRLIEELHKKLTHAYLATFE